jgi:hypothetical protein
MLNRPREASEWEVGAGDDAGRRGDDRVATSGLSAGTERRMPEVGDAAINQHVQSSIDVANEVHLVGGCGAARGPEDSTSTQVKGVRDQNYDI